MRDGYLIAKCLVCGSTIFLKIRGVKGASSQCPICSEYALSVMHIQPCLQLVTEVTRDVSTVPDIIQKFLNNAAN